MSFKQLASDFDNIVIRFSGTNKSHKDLIDEIRDNAALAGSLLHDEIESNKINPPPDSLSPWLKYIFRKASGVRFKEVISPVQHRMSGYEVTKRGKLYTNEDNLIYTFHALQSAYDEYEKYGRTGTNYELFKYRHLFYEAATLWLPKTLKKKIIEPMLPKWEVITSRGKLIYFVSDWTILENDEIYFAIPLAKACSQACELLSSKLDKRKKKKKSKSSSKLKSNREAIPLGWVRLKDYCTKYNVPHSTAHTWANKLKDNECKKHEYSSAILVKVSAMKPFLNNWKTNKKRRHKR